jgi:hypothetical protein
MTAKLIAAYTPPTSPYPPYVNVSREDNGGVTITVRAPPGPGEFSDKDCGPTSAIFLAPEAWDDLRAGIICNGAP